MKVKNAKGNIIYFNNVIIIMTSNIGFDDIYVGFQPKKESLVQNKLREYFSSPFINRIDNIITFHFLSEENIKTIIKMKLSELKKKYREQIKIKIKDSVNYEILEKINYKEFGARKIDKMIKDFLENKIIDAIIESKKEIKIVSLKDEVTM